MIQLLRLDSNTIINTEKILQITVENLNKLRYERNQHHQTPEQQERMNDKYWEVSVYLRSDSGYNAQRYTKRFQTEQDAQHWVQQKFGAVIVNNL